MRRNKFAEGCFAGSPADIDSVRLLQSPALRVGIFNTHLIIVATDSFDKRSNCGTACAAFPYDDPRRTQKNVFLV